MIRKKRGMSFLGGRDQYVDEILEAGRRELEELQKEPEEREAERQRKRQMEQDMSAGERFYAALGAVMAGLIIAGIFILAMFLFLLLCTKVWLR